MRILHTSDWHLGQNLMGKTREPEHQAFLHWLAETLERHQVDTLLVVGDIFDTATPPSYAREMYHQFLVSLHRAQACQQVILLGGNHDSVAVLNESKALLDCLDIRVLAGVGERIEQHLLPLRNRRGELSAMLCALPYIRSRDVLSSQPGRSLQERQQALEQGIHDLYTRLYQLAKERAPEGCPILATGHMTLRGGRSSDSERSLYIGSLEALSVQPLPPFDYLALGHLHRAQSIGEGDTRHYCGSPIPLSFSEAGQEKSVTLVDLAPEAELPLRSQRLPVPQSQSLLSYTGTLEHLEQQFATLPPLPAGQRHWLEVSVEGDKHLTDLQNRLQRMLEGLPVELLCTRRARAKTATALELADESLHTLSHREVFDACMQNADISPEQQPALRQLYQRLWRDLLEEPMA